MLSQFYLPYLGGEELLVRNLSVELVRRGHEVSLVTLRLPGTPRFEVSQGIRIYRVAGLFQRLPWLYGDRARRFAPPLPDPGVVAAIARVVADTRPHVVHAHNWLGYSFLPLKKWSGARLIVSLHDYSLSCATRTFMHRGRAICSGPGPLKCFSCAAEYYGTAKGLATVTAHRAMSPLQRRGVDLFLPISRFVAEANDLPRHALPYRTTPEFVTDDVASVTGDGRAWLDQLPRSGYLLYVGAFRRIKGIEVLLQAYATLESAPPLVLVGYTTPDAGGPIAFPPHVVVLRDWPNEGVMWAWRHCMMAIVPSLWAEPFGIVALEAMASGKPVIASGVGGLVDVVVDSQTGLVVPPGDAVALADAMRRLLREPELRATMGAAGKRRVAEFQAHAIVPRVEQAYRAVLDGGPIRPRASGHEAALGASQR